MMLKMATEMVVGFHTAIMIYFNYDTSHYVNTVFIFCTIHL